MGGRFEGKVVVVTGAAGQIGSEAAVRFVAEGAKVVAADVDEDRLSSVVDQIGNSERDAIAVGADLAHSGAAEQVIEAAERKFGPVYALAAIHGGIGRVLPARNGSTEGPRLNVGKISDAEWERMMDRNLRSQFLTCRAAVDGMVERAEGRIVTVASISMSGQPWMRDRILAHYSSAKAGLVAFTRVLALQVADKGVIVNCVVPGAIQGPDRLARSERERPGRLETLRRRIPRGRVGHPADIAQMVLFLCSEAADFIVGQSIHVNGGEWAP